MLPTRRGGGTPTASPTALLTIESQQVNINATQQHQQQGAPGASCRVREMRDTSAPWVLPGRKATAHRMQRVGRM